ncbi:cell division protein FtsY homolog [Legionella cherrii]|uniref:Cell division protein FtsY homolog n=1 Tax=Legionella cherrii TaxID=28084 RepID=A0ABY6T1P0_9GAMM|nr:hypothetical protein [Legionella cherrii]VEB33121.1 cell division protein FtsY homolog [Legionella cherrii]
MIKWFKRSHDSTSAEADHSQSVTDSMPEVPEEVIEQGQEPAKEGIFARFRKGLSKTRHQLGDGIGRLLLGKKEISQDLMDELETLLISADLVWRPLKLY